MSTFQQKPCSSRSLPRLLALLIFALVHAFISSCSQLPTIPAAQSSPTASAVNQRVEVCNLITTEEISNIVGETIERTNTGGCSFSLPFKDKPINQVITIVGIKLDQFPGKQEASTIFATKERFPGKEIRKISGFGDKAYVSAKSWTILKENFILEISLNGDMNDEQRQKRLESLAQLVLQRLVLPK
jgi:hypothetical protein